ncbi:YlmC/YmxH family sporulation protein [Aquibacillus koreensis]|uniref:YlmC/YmxH family sporulation protein n=1 Tax=Aquibacillus koreensis TaxID=279446 RepID=A0A9X3WNG6_9BACI|nr:YlmC/YmxH family sporulation protein [Aquibacillus koreensis]MCT2538048.1 YlmC/YmxH family sporulation protein [Aquibacillus koreensis]MDC3420571.1 YlmC/YmxH family sporulation protein [Aquibacillus koreensis]
MITLSDLQIKDIIMIEDGRKLGNITDLEIDVDKGKIIYLIIGAKGKMMGLFGKEEEITIPWENIVTIGSDVILVKKADHPRLFSGYQDPQVK